MSNPNAGQTGITDSWSDDNTFHAPVISTANSTTSSVTTGRKAKIPHIPDDWDDEEDEDEDIVESNDKVWEDANSRSPMPQVIMSTTSSHSTSGFGSNPPPPEALSGPLRILRRPKDASALSLTRSNSGASTNSQLTLAEREAKYQAARERIFSGQQPQGAKGNSLNTRSASADNNDTSPYLPAPSPGSMQASPQSVIRISRNPRGPDSSNVPGEPSRGFDTQRRKNTEIKPSEVSNTTIGSSS